MPGIRALESKNYRKMEVLKSPERLSMAKLLIWGILGFRHLLRCSVMRDLAVLFIHLITTIARLAGPGGAVLWSPNLFWSSSNS
jgi:hypothetical protein